MPKIVFLISAAYRILCAGYSLIRLLYAVGTVESPRYTGERNNGHTIALETVWSRLASCKQLVSVTRLRYHGTLHSQWWGRGEKVSDIMGNDVGRIGMQCRLQRYAVLFRGRRTCADCCRGGFSLRKRHLAARVAMRRALFSSLPARFLWGVPALFLGSSYIRVLSRVSTSSHPVCLRRYVAPVCIIP
jgi:hypothetical protein